MSTLKKMRIIKRFRRGPGKPTMFRGMDLTGANKLASEMNSQRSNRDQHWYEVQEQ